MKIRLHWKFTAFFCLTVFIILAATYLYLNVHLKSYLDERLRNNVKKELLLGKSLLDRHLDGKLEASEADYLASAIGNALEIRVTIVGLNGVVLGDSDIGESKLAAVENHIDRPEIKEALKTGIGQDSRYSHTLKKYMFYMAAVLGKEKPAGFLRLSVPVSDIKILDSGIFKITGFAILLAFATALMLNFAISIVVTKPIVKMSAAAKVLAEGKFSERILVNSKDEIGDLAEAFNHMSEEIKGKIEKITSAEAELKAILSAMAEGVIVTDAKGRIVLANPAVRRFFLMDSPAEGRMFFEAIRNTGIQGMIDGVLKEGRKSSAGEISLDLPEKKTFMASCSSIAKEGKTEGAVLVFYDISELRRLENVRRDFVANVSHELRTPLSSIKGYSETLLSADV
ncbi:MAG: HAMP domain-containing protein [Candidatus Omnitrophota bacterium]